MCLPILAMTESYQNSKYSKYSLSTAVQRSLSENLGIRWSVVVNSSNLQHGNPFHRSPIFGGSRRNPPLLWELSLFMDRQSCLRISCCTIISDVFDLLICPSFAATYGRESHLASRQTSIPWKEVSLGFLFLELLPVAWPTCLFLW
jgi:hypothetical protein